MSDSTRSDPFAELYGDFGDRLHGDRWQPDADVLETENEVVVRVELAGVASGDLRVSVDGSEVRVSGLRAPHESGPVKRLHQMEIASGPFERRVHIPVAFDREQVSAHLANGFLTVTLSKRGRRTVPVGGTQADGT
ncbi:MAG: Hsp20/alpha crystallin family protein [Myxococcota bacterium]